jgi:hypothetical protein
MMGILLRSLWRCLPHLEDHTQQIGETCLGTHRDGPYGGRDYLGLFVWEAIPPTALDARGEIIHPKKPSQKETRMTDFDGQVPLLQIAIEVRC